MKKNHCSNVPENQNNMDVSKISQEFKYATCSSGRNPIVFVRKMCLSWIFVAEEEKEITKVKFRTTSTLVVLSSINFKTLIMLYTIV